MKVTLPYPLNVAPQCYYGHMATICKKCGELIPEAKRKRRAVYCSEKCGTENYRSRWRALNPITSVPLTTGTRGALSELRVAIDLLERGFEVFRAMSPSCSCDLAILKDGELLRVEVRTGYQTVKGGVMWPKSNKDMGKQDVWAVVIGDKIFYEPDLKTSHRKPEVAASG